MIGLRKPEYELPSRSQRVALFSPEDPLILSSGERLEKVEVAYQTYGRLNERGDNAILICHALTGSAHVSDCGFPEPSPLGEGWWNQLVDEGRPVDPRHDFVICSNFLGSCYGTTGPVSVNPRSGTNYGPDFPEIDVRDMVRVQKRLLEHLGVARIRCALGGSLGGMQVLEWCAMYPEMVRSAVVIATSAAHSAWAIGFNESARQAILGDPAWQGGRYREQPAQGLALARTIAMISYRSQVSYQERFGRGEMAPGDPRQVADPAGGPSAWQIENYLRYQGEKLVKRFDANTYLTITRAMDRHDLGRDRGGVEAALAAFPMPVLCVGISSDVLYPPHEQRQIARHIPHAQYAEIQSEHGHDAFLIEFEQLNELVEAFLAGPDRDLPRPK
ncbi:MAG TPA: homoserine O-acetyltransferase [Calditrichia bacterium]|nr:homoserine O-acetyltransferase [Calditrichia bacterium]